MKTFMKKLAIGLLGLIITFGVSTTAFAKQITISIHQAIKFIYQ